MSDFRAGYIGLIGFPNAGKSSLMNKLVKDRVSIVTSKAQTTRKRIEGVISTDHGQLIMVDAPGIVKAQRGLNQFLQAEYENVMTNVDALVAVLNLDSDSAEKLDAVLELVVSYKKPWMALITKTDLSFNRRIPMVETKVEVLGGKSYLFSIKDDEKSDGKLIDEMLKLVPESPEPLFPTDLVTTQPMRDLVCEIVRGKCFEFLFQELPYELAVRMVLFDESGGATGKGVPKIHVEIVLNKENQKNIVIGKNGEVIKRIGSTARKEIEDFMGEKIFLDLHVVVRKDWLKNKNILKELGYAVRET